MDIVNTGKWSYEEIDTLLIETSTLDYQKRIDFISSLFISTPYKGNTLIGSKDVKEILVINLKEVDCFTYIDYVQAMSMSKSFDDLKEKLRAIRYKDAEVDFFKRRHFFTDWAYSKPSFVTDVTSLIGMESTKKKEKLLNLKKESILYLEGLPLIKRTIYYIPSERVNKSIINSLNTGDFIGIYSHEKGLDVSHVGIFIKKDDGKTLFRHASSFKKKVVEQDFLRYISKTPGIVVLRGIK
ncbi:MAG TPA: DUF1460 domain-containing protein [Nitrospirae bacterium]|nr:DUF1460 domain-containing protein [Nitrospirota bacterium]